jgi:hypothetical protein
MEVLQDRLLAPLPPIEPGADAESWRIRRRELLDLVVDLEYGGMPPEPETLRVEQLQHSLGEMLSMRIHVNEAFSFTMQVYKPIRRPTPGTKFPVILTGDGCYHNCNDTVISDAYSHGFAVAKFNRVEIAHDTIKPDRIGGIYDLYPNTTFGAISAWAWGYSRAMDALETLDIIDSTKVAITGHSRGGKTVLLAGAVDERFAYVHTNCSGCGGAGCFRYRTEPRNGLRGNERLQDILRAVPYWFGPKLPAYIGKDHTLPFDQHFLKAAVAPRMLIETSAREDTWANPVGSYLTYEAAREVYQLLGVPDNIAYRIRPGGHAHTPEDFNVLFAFMENPLSVTDGYDIKP